MCEFYFNTATGEVEEGKQSSWLHRMGPYSTREEAARAYEVAVERNRQIDESDESWKRTWDDEEDD
ncbi:hypothetical protein I6E29_03800 [Arcanobacterium haemolyticum]|nr:hypothetical protein [Arcanobacterium haemolyticum]